jgi:tellurium resistance protein TerZ
MIDFFGKRSEMPTEDRRPNPNSQQQHHQQQKEQPTSGGRGSLEAMDLEITVIQGHDLTAKDRGCFGFGKRQSSDPYVKVFLVQHEQDHKIFLGRTRTIYKSLNPTWKDTIHGCLRGHNALRNHTQDHPAKLEFQIFDEDPFSQDDPMGIVQRNLPLLLGDQQQHQPTTTDETRTYDVLPASANHAQGSLQIRLKTRLLWSHILVRGNSFVLSSHHHHHHHHSLSQHSLPRQIPFPRQVQRTIQMGLSWDDNEVDDVLLLRQGVGRGDGDDFVTGFHEERRKRHGIDVDASCVAVSYAGEVVMPDTVYYGNIINSNHSAWHNNNSGNRNDKVHEDDETITLQLDRIPKYVLAMYLIVTIATPNMTLKHLKSIQVTVRDVTSVHHTTMKKERHAPQQQHTLCLFTPSSNNRSDTNHENATAMFMLRMARDLSSEATLPGNNQSKLVHASTNKEWILSPMEHVHPTARDFGSLIPHVKAYSRDLVPRGIPIDLMTDRVAVLRKGDSIRLTDYCPDNILSKTRITFGLTWNDTVVVAEDDDDDDGGDDKRSVDLDVSAICLDQHLNLVDLVWWKQLHSKDYNIIHHGDERKCHSHNTAGDDNEQIDLYLHNISLMGKHNHIRYIGFVVNSYSGQKLNDVAQASCHLFDPESNVEIATHSLINAKSKSLDGVTALLVGCLYRAPQQQKYNNAGTNQQQEHHHSHHHDDGANNNEWCLAIISEPSNGRTVKANVEIFRDYLKKRNPLHPPPVVTENNDGAGAVVGPLEMPRFVPLAREDAVVSPMSQGKGEDH